MEYIFIGNRPNVLKKMLDLGCEIKKIYAVKSSYLEAYLLASQIKYVVIENKSQLIKDLINNNFDCLVSNGCPYILPISSLRTNNDQLFINIHPSLLPDLKGRHPINGSILFGRPHGVTCHHMDDGIDTGEIIQNIEISYDLHEVSLDLLYQVSFQAEAKVFEMAYNSDFKKTKLNYQGFCKNPIYYTRKEKDLLINLSDPIELILRKIHAFGIPSICAKILYNNKLINVINAKSINSAILSMLYGEAEVYSILLKYGSKILVKFKDGYIEFELLDKNSLSVGDILG